MHWFGYGVSLTPAAVHNMTWLCSQSRVPECLLPPIDSPSLSQYFDSHVQWYIWLIGIVLNIGPVFLCLCFHPCSIIIKLFE